MNEEETMNVHGVFEGAHMLVPQWSELNVFHDYFLIFMYLKRH